MVRVGVGAQKLTFVGVYHLLADCFYYFFEFDGVMENETVKRTLPDKDK